MSGGFAAIESAMTQAVMAAFGESVTSPYGVFVGIIDAADADVFETVRVGTHTLRYSDAIPLVVGDIITILGASYKVVGLPKRLDADEFSADLVKQ